jgi:hypothetical protein
MPDLTGGHPATRDSATAWAPAALAPVSAWVVALAALVTA